MNELPTLESGKIWENRTTKEILYGIARAKKSDYAVLRIASQDIDVDGEILIAKNTTIQGARLIEQEVDGYTALRALLLVTDGTYSLVDFNQSQAMAAHLEQNLKIRINQIINTLPNLPDTYEELVGGAAVGKIRTFDTSEFENPAASMETSLKEKRFVPEKELRVETAEEASKRTLPVTIIGVVAVIMLAVISIIVVMAFKPAVPTP